MAFLFLGSGNFLFGQAPALDIAAPVNEARIKYAGLQGDMLLFDVQLDNLPANGASLKITDNFGNIIFEEKIVESTLYRRYMIPKSDLEMITFKITGKIISFKQ